MNCAEQTHLARLRAWPCMEGLLYLITWQKHPFGSLGGKGALGGGNRESRPACLACSHLRGLTLQVSSEFLSAVLELCSLPPSVAGSLPASASEPVPPLCSGSEGLRPSCVCDWRPTPPCRLCMRGSVCLITPSSSRSLICASRLLPGLQFSDERRLPLGGFSDSWVSRHIELAPSQI